MFKITTIAIMVLGLSCFANDEDNSDKRPLITIYSNLGITQKSTIIYDPQNQQIIINKTIIGAASQKAALNLNYNYPLKNTSDLDKFLKYASPIIKHKNKLAEISIALNHYLKQNKSCPPPTRNKQTNLIDLLDQSDEISKIVSNDKFSSNQKSINFEINGNTFYLNPIFNQFGEIENFTLTTKAKKDDLKNLKIDRSGKHLFILDKKTDKALFVFKPEETFDKKKGGVISLSRINEKGDLFKYTFNLSKKNDRWPITSRSNNLGEIDLSSDANPDDNTINLQEILLFPFTLFGKLIDSTITTIAINLLNKEKMIKKAVMKGAKKNCIFNEAEPSKSLLPKKEVEKIAKSISKTESIAFQPRTKSFIINKKASLQLSEGIAKYQLSTLCDLSLDTPVVKKGAKTIIKDLELCLEKAEENIQYTYCMNHFSASAPHRIGMEILKIKISKNLSEHLKDTDMINKANDEAVASYNKCMSERFFVVTTAALESEKSKKPKKKKKSKNNCSKSDGSLKVVQGCVYAGILDGLDLTVNNKIDDLLSNKLPKDYPKNKIKLISDQTEENFSTCLKNKKFLNPRNEFKEYNYQVLESTKPNIFKKGLFSCVDSLTRKTGEQVVKAILEFDPRVNSLFKDSSEDNSSRKNEFIKEVIRDGYNRCINVQKKADPLLCQKFIELTAFKQGVLDSLEKTLIEGKVANKNIQKILKNVRLCHENIDQGFLQQAKNGIIDDEKNKILLKDSLSCLKNGIIKTSGSYAVAKLKTSLKEDPRLKELKIRPSPPMKKILKDTVGKCFKDKLKQITTSDRLSNKSTIENITNICKKRGKNAIIPTIVKDATYNSLNKYIKNGTLDKKQKAKIIELFLKDLNSKRKPKIKRRKLKLLNILTKDLSPILEKNDPKLLDQYLNNFKIKIAEISAPYIVKNSLNNKLKGHLDLKSTPVKDLIKKTEILSQACMHIYNDQKNNRYKLKEEDFKELITLYDNKNKEKKQSSISTDDWLEECTKHLTFVAGRDATALIIFNNPMLDSIFPAKTDLEKENKLKFIYKILEKSYDICMNLQKKKKQKLNPEKCRSKIVAEAATMLMDEKIKQDLGRLFPTVNTDKRPKFHLSDKTINQNKQITKDIIDKIFSGDQESKKMKKEILDMYNTYSKEKNPKKKELLLKKANDNFEIFINKFTTKAVSPIVEEKIKESINDYYHPICRLDKTKKKKALKKMVQIDYLKYHKILHQCINRDNLINNTMNDALSGLNSCLNRSKNYKKCIIDASLYATKLAAKPAIDHVLFSELKLPKNGNEKSAEKLTNDFNDCIEKIKKDPNLNMLTLQTKINRCQTEIPESGLVTLLPQYTSIENYVPLLPKWASKPYNKILKDNIEKSVLQCTKLIDKNELFKDYMVLFNACISYGLNTNIIKFTNEITSEKLVQDHTVGSYPHSWYKRSVATKIRRKTLESEKSIIQDACKKYNIECPKSDYESNRNAKEFLKAISYAPDHTIDTKWSKETAASNIKESLGPLEKIINWFF